MSETSWNAMTYDEQRALLGLPDVRMYVAWTRIRLQMLEVKQVFTQAFEAIRPAMTAIEEFRQDYALAGEK